jgi:hypothetical protein
VVGAGGGHDRFLWTHYQDPAATAAVLTTTAKQLMRFGFRALIFVAGHYPWQGMLDEHLPAVQSEFSNRLLRPEDATHIFRVFSDPEVTRHYDLDTFKSGARRKIWWRASDSVFTSGSVCAGRLPQERIAA